MNKVMLMGRFTKDPEIRYTSSNNTAVCGFTLAVAKRFQKQGAERKADFINCQAWAKTAEFIGKYFRKGSQVVVVGRIETRAWEDNEGKKHYVTEVIAEEVYFADSRRSDSQPTGQQQNNSGSDASGGFYPVDDDDSSLPF
jgi:single-strand DNA-binding protein